MSVKFCLLFILAFLSVHDLAEAANGFVGKDQKFRSPNGRYCAQLIDGYDKNLLIKDNSSGLTFYSTVIAPLLSIRWTGNSKAMVVVEHMAGGSSAAILYMLGDATTRFNALPPDNSTFCKVIEETVGNDMVHLTYLLSTRKRDAHWTCSFDIDPATGVISHKITKPINLGEAKQLENNPK